MPVPSKPGGTENFSSRINIVDRFKYVSCPSEAQEYGPNTTTIKSAIDWVISCSSNNNQLRDCPMMKVFTVIDSKGETERQLARQRVAKACEDLFGEVARRVRAVCMVHKLTIKHIVLTVPAHWAVAAKQYYEDRLRSADDSPAAREDVAVDFMPEPAGFAHYVFNDPHTRQAIVDAIFNNPDGVAIVLIADFGGYTYVSAFVCFWVLLLRRERGHFADTVGRCPKQGNAIYHLVLKPYDQNGTTAFEAKFFVFKDPKGKSA